MEDEKDLIKSQRNHLVSLKEGTSLENTTFAYHGELSDRKVKMAPVRSRRSLDSLMNDNLKRKPVKVETELPCRDDVNPNTSLPLHFHDSVPLVQHKLDTAPYLSTPRNATHARQVANHEMDHKRKDISITRKQRDEYRQSTQSLESNSKSHDDILERDSVISSLPMSRKELSSEYGDTVLHTSVFQTENPSTTERRVEKSALRPSQGKSVFNLCGHVWFTGVLTK